MYTIEIKRFRDKVFHWKLTCAWVPGGVQVGHASSLEYAMDQMRRWIGDAYV